MSTNSDKHQSKFVPPKLSDFVDPNNNNKGASNVSSDIQTTQPAPEQIKPKAVCLTSSDLQLRSEIIWALKLCQSNFSFSSCAEINGVFAAMFPDSQIAANFSLSRSKVSYLIANGLGPYFTQQLVNEIQSSPETYFTLHFDETTTIQMKKQMDLLVRFYCSPQMDSCKVGGVEVRFLASFTFGHAFGENVADAITTKLEQLNLPLAHLLSVSTDSPNVNKTVKRLLNNSVKQARGNGAPGLVDIGFCTIHVVSNSFRKAIEHYGKALEDLIINLYYFFKSSSARREDFEKVQNDLGLDEQLHFIRHVQTRWLTLIDALERLAARYEAAVQFFIHFIPSQPQNKDVMASERYKKIVTMLKDEETLVQLHFLISVKPVFDSYLRVFQTEGPLVHCLHQSMIDLIKMLLLRFMKASEVNALQASEMKQLDVTKNHLKHEEIDIGPVTKGLLKKTKSQRSKTETYFAIVKFYETATKYLIQNMPLDNKLLKALGCLHPQVRKSSTSARRILTVAQSMPFITQDDLNRVSDEWRKYATDDDEVNADLRVDRFWWEVLNMKEASGTHKFTVLSKVVKAALSLSHGNADSERALSINKRMLGTERALLSTDTINGIRACKDAVEQYDDKPSDVPITRLMLSSCRNAHRAYQLKLKEAKDVEDQKKMEEQMKNEAFEQSKKQKESEIQSLKSKEDSLTKEEKKNDEEYICAKHMLKGARDYLTKCIESDDKSGLKAAADMIANAESRMMKAEKQPSIRF